MNRKEKMMNEHRLTQEQLTQYEADGYIVLPSFFDTEEIELLSQSAKEDHMLDQKSYGRDDGEGGNVRLSLWSEPGDNIYGMFARCGRIVTSMEQLLGGDVGHYHTKMIMKDAKVGGAWAWHQDYGYWYDFGYLFPDLTSVMICIDKATKENGCLQVIKGSHKIGRVNHDISGEQAGADPGRVKLALERLELVYCEINPGDTIFFHSNLLHRSDQNRSDKPRWAMVCCYSLIGNDSASDPLHPEPCKPVDKVPESAIKEAGLLRFSASADSTFLTPDECLDKTESK